MQMDISQLALVLIDIQRDFWRPLEKFPQFASFPANIRALLTTARARELGVVHIQSVFQADRSDWMLFYRPQGRGQIPCIEGSSGVTIESFATPAASELVIRKQTFDGFVNPELESALRARNVKAVMFAGLESSVCVLFTASCAYLGRCVRMVVRACCAAGRWQQR